MRVRMRVYVTCVDNGKPSGCVNPACVRLDCGNISWRERGTEGKRKRIVVAAEGKGKAVLTLLLHLGDTIWRYTRCLCRLADSVDSRLKSRTFVCEHAPLFLFLSYAGLG